MIDFFRNLPPSVKRFGGALCIAMLGVALQYVLHLGTGNQVPFLFMMPAVAVSAALLGRGPALIVVAAGAVNAALFYPPLGSWRIDRAADATAFGAYLALSAAIIFFAGRMRLITTRVALAEEHLKLAQEDTGIGVYELDFVNNTAFVSPSLRQLLAQPGIERSMPLDEWLGRLHPDHVAETRRVLEERIARGELRYEREQCIRLDGGGERWLLTRVRIDLTPGGGLASARGATVDITERKVLDQQLHRAQADLKQQVADMRQLHALGQDLGAIGDDLPASMRSLLTLILEFNGASHGVLALRSAGAGSFTAVALRGLDAEAASAFASIAVNPDTDPEITELALIGRRAGFAQVHGIRMRSSDGQVIGLVAVLFTEPHAMTEREIRLCEVCATMGSAVVERARARAEAADEERRFAVALESAAVPFSILVPVRDAAGRLIDMRWSYVNPAGARLFGHPVADLVGRQVTEILPRGWETPGLLERYTAVLDRDEAISFETPASPHNPGVWFQVIASPLLGSVAVWFADISERKRQEGLRDEADRRKDEFLATLAHELRNPLAPIRQGIRIARSAAATDEQRRWSHDVIERQVKNMALLLDDLLDVSRISRGTLLLRRAAVALPSVVEAAVEVARPHIDAKGHRLEVNLPAAPVTLDVDLLRIAQVVGNLLTNAAKYTDPGGRVALQAGVEAGEFVIRVIDNGIGLAPDQTARLFEMFAQVPSAMGRSQGGLGIGLALSRRLVQLHGGDIEAASDGPGCGSEFTIRLPASAVISAPAPSTHPAASAPSAAHRILIADDNADAADSLAELLRIDGHEVYVAYDGQQALAHFRRHEPDAVLLDIGMPKLTGLDVARAIRRLPAGRRTTLIAITGWGQSQDRLGAIEAGFDHHTTKPVDPALILGLIDAGRSPATFNRAAAPEEAPGG